MVMAVPNVPVGAPAAGSITPTQLAQPFTEAVAVATTSGVAIDFTSIPSWVKRITLLFNGVSTNGTSSFLVRVGSGSITTSGYNSTSQRSASSVSVENTSTTGFIINTVSATTTLFGVLTLCRQTGDTWVGSGVFSDSSGVSCFNSNGAKGLGGALDRLRLTTVNGTDTFDAGSVNIFYE